MLLSTRTETSTEVREIRRRPRELRHIVDSPAQVQAAAATGLQNVWRVTDALDLRESITLHDQAGKLYWFNPHRAYLSSGPALDYWDCINKMYWGSPAQGHDR